MAVIIGVTIIQTTGVVGLCTIGGLAWWRDPVTTQRHWKTAAAPVLQMLTILSIIPTVVLLCALDALSEGAVAILSGIAGFVLGGFRTQGDRPARKLDPSPISN